MSSADELDDEKTVSCANCRAACCKLEVILFTDTGVPEKYIQRDEWGGEVMARLEDGWCAALDRETFFCSIYQNRPLICREFEMASPECRDEFTSLTPLKSLTRSKNL